MESYKNKTIKLIIVFLILIPVFEGSSQESDTIISSTINRQKSLNVTDIKDITKDGFNFWQDEFNGHFAGIDFGFNTFLNKSYSGYAPEFGDFMKNDFFRSNSLFY